MPDRSLPESCSHLSTLYRGDLVGIDDWCCGGQDTAREEWAEDDCVVVTRRGVWELEIAGEARHADPLTATCWNRHAPYRVRHPIGGGDRCTIFRLTEKGRATLRAAAGREPRRPTFNRRTQSLTGPVYLQHRTALTRARACHDALAIEEAVIGFLGQVMQGDGAGAEGWRPASAYVAETQALIARRFREPLTVEQIAREVHCSPFHLCRLFQQSTGTTIHRTVMRLRLREGLERLLDEPASLAAIALDVGFATHSHFTDAFRAEYGCAPREARERGRLGK